MVVGGFNVTSFTPGRLRLKVDEIKRSAEFASRVREALTRVPGIYHVELNATTGSVLVHYDTIKIKHADGRHELTKVIAGLFPGADIELLQSWLGRSG